MPDAPSAAAAMARDLYLKGVPIGEIRAATGLSVSTIYYWADRTAGPDGRMVLNPAPRRRREPSATPKPDRRRQLVSRLWRAAERQVSEIEKRLATLGAPPAEAERDARALAVLARVLRELAALDGTAKARKAPDREADLKRAEDAVAPYDLDTFRRELARRLEALRADEPG